MNKQKGNELIAEFMGFRFPKKQNEGYTPNKEFSQKLWNTDPYEGYSLDQLKFNTSWDWLMPVIDKIENIELSKSDHPHFAVKIVGSTCEVMRCRNNYVHKTISHYFEDSKLENTYKAIVEFIKWYNKQQNNNPLDHTPTPEESPYLYKRKEHYV